MTVRSFFPLPLAERPGVRTPNVTLSSKTGSPFPAVNRTTVEMLCAGKSGWPSISNHRHEQDLGDNELVVPEGGTQT